jgi:tetratricopeptide (TPR) repeat protein
MKRRILLRIPALVGAVALVGCVQPEERVVSSQRKPSWKNANAEALTAAKDLPPPEIRAETHVAAAKLFESQGNIGQAMTQYRKALAVDPECAEAHGRLGVLLGKIRRHAEAESALQAAVRLRPRSAPLRNNLGYEYMLQERWADAEAELRNAIRLQPDYRRAHVNLGVALCKQGLFDDGLAEFEAVLSEGDAFYNLGLMYRAAGRYREAADALAYTLKIAPEMNAARVQLGQLADRLQATEMPQSVPDHHVAGTPAPASIRYVPGPAAPSIPPLETELAVRPMMLTGAELDSSGENALDDEVPGDSNVLPIPSTELAPSDTPIDEFQESTPTEPTGIEPASPAIDEPVAEPPLEAAAVESPEVSETESAELPDESLAPIVTPDALDEADIPLVPADTPSDDHATWIEAPLDVPVETGATDALPDMMAPLELLDAQPAPATGMEPLGDDWSVPDPTEPSASDSPDVPDYVFAEMMETVPVDIPADGILPWDDSSTVEEPDGPALAMIDLRTAPWTKLITGAEADERLPSGDVYSADPVRVPEEVLDDWWLSVSQGTRAMWMAWQAWIDACAHQWPAAAPTDEMDSLHEPPPESMPRIVTPEPVPIEGDLAEEADCWPQADRPTAEPNPP